MTAAAKKKERAGDAIGRVRWAVVEKIIGSPDVWYQLDADQQKELRAIEDKLTSITAQVHKEARAM